MPQQKIEMPKSEKCHVRRHQLYLSPTMPVKNDSIPSQISDWFFLTFSVGWKKVMPHGKRWAARLFLASALLAPQACFADLIDKYVNTDPFSSWKLFQVPKVRDSMRKVLGRERLKFVRELDRLGDFEVLQDPELGRVLYVLLFLQHFASSIQASLFIRSDGETIAGCTSNVDVVWSGPDWQIKMKFDESPCGGGLDPADDPLKRLNAAKARAKGERQPAQQ